MPTYRRREFSCLCWLGGMGCVVGCLPSKQCCSCKENVSDHVSLNSVLSDSTVSCKNVRRARGTEAKMSHETIQNKLSVTRQLDLSCQTNDKLNNSKSRAVDYSSQERYQRDPKQELLCKCSYLRKGDKHERPRGFANGRRRKHDVSCHPSRYTTFAAQPVVGSTGRRTSHSSFKLVADSSTRSLPKPKGPEEAGDPHTSELFPNPRGEHLGKTVYVKHGGQWFRRRQQGRLVLRYGLRDELHV